MIDSIAIDQLRQSVPISDVVRRYVPLRSGRREAVGCCPFHKDRTPSFTVNDDKGVFHCFGCQAAGDVFDFVMRIEGIGFREAAEIIGSGAFSMRALPKRPVARRSTDTRQQASRLWDAAQPIIGTVVERYLANRGLPIAGLGPLPMLRFAELPYPGSFETHPTLIAALHDIDGKLCGIQRTFLTHDGRKAAVEKAKMSLGIIKGGAIRLGDPTEQIIVCEGLEDGLSLRLKLSEQTVWVAAGAGMLSGMLLPDTCRSVVIAADNDEAGQKAAEHAAVTFTNQGRIVREMRPLPSFKDFNAQLLGEHV